MSILQIFNLVLDTIFVVALSMSIGCIGYVYINRIIDKHIKNNKFTKEN